MNREVDIQKNVYEILSKFDGEMGLYFEDINEEKVFSINPDRKIQSASTIKIPIISLLFIKADKGEINLDEKVEISEENRVGGSGIIKEIDKSYKPTIMDLATLMIILSDNIATNMLIDIVGMKDVNDFCEELSMKNTVLQRKMMDINAKKKGLDNFTSAHDLGIILKKLARGTIYSEKVSKMVTDILKRQQVNGKLPRLVPALEPDDDKILCEDVEENRVVIAHKTGELDFVEHDAGIFYLPDRRIYTLSIMTENLSNNQEGVLAIANLSKAIYDNMR